MQKPVLTIKTKVGSRLIWLCVFLACMAPRFISTLKIPIGIGISPYTVIVLSTCCVCIRKFKFYLKIEHCLFVIWFVFVVGSIWRAEKLGVWAYYLNWTLTTLCFLQILYVNNGLDSFISAASAMECALVTHLLIGMYEISAHRYLFEVGVFARRYYGTTAISIFHNPNDYVTFIVTVLPFSIYLLVNRKNFIMKLISGLAVLLTVFLTIVSRSRGGLISLFLIAFVGLYLLYKKSTKYKLIFIIMAILFVVATLSIPSIREYFLPIFLENKIDIEQRDLVRINLMKNGLYFLNKTYGFGVGAGNLYQWLEEKSIYYIANIKFLHNWYLEILVTFGVFFFALYMFFHFKIIVVLIKSYDKRERFWNLNNTFLISFSAFSLVSISSSSNTYSEWVWMYLALTATFCLFNCHVKHTKKRIDRYNACI